MNILSLDCAITRISLAVKTDSKFISETYDIGMRQAEMTGFAGFWMANYETLNIYVDILSALAALVVPLYIVVMVYKNKALAGVESGVSVAVEAGAESDAEAE